MIESLFIALGLFALTYLPAVAITGVWTKYAKEKIITLQKTFLSLVFLSISTFDALILIFGISGGNYISYGFNIGNELIMPTAIITVLILRAILSLLANLIPQKKHLYISSSSFTLPELFINCIFVSISEEIIFRGLIQSYLSVNISCMVYLFNSQISLPAIISAVLFALLHLGLLLHGKTSRQLLLILPGTFIFGVIAGYFRDATGSLLTPIVIHIIFNFSGKGVEFIKLKYLS